jgi:hypothetical protein
MNRPCAILAVSLLACTGCRTLAPLSAEQYRQARAHTVFINEDGHAVLPDTLRDARILGAGDSVEYGRYLSGLMDGIRGSGKRDVMLRIHGGLNSLREQVDTNISITKAIEADSPDSSRAFYPLYVNWESSMRRSYLDHLFFVRQGHSYRNGHPLGWGLAPLYLTADLGRAVARTPLLWKAQITSFWGNGAATAERLARDSAWSSPPEGHVGPTPKPCDRSAANAALPRANPRQVALELCPFRPRASEIWIDRAFVVLSPLPLLPTLPWPRHASGGTAKWFSTRLPTRIFDGRVKLFSPWMAEHVSMLRVPPAPFAVILIDAFGKPAYDNMRRRTKTMFRDAHELAPRADRIGSSYRRPTGALPQFIDSLSALVQQSHGAATDSVRYCWGRAAPAAAGARTDSLRVTLIAHSMGAVIAAGILRSCPTFAVENIVLMAPALSVNEFERDVLPYLGSHPRTRLYLLMLHPRAERLEVATGKPYLIHGSLLTWLDGFLSAPETDGDRMMGRFENAIAAMHLIPDSLRGRVYVKGFGYRGDQSRFYPRGKPYQHAHFGEARLRFWRCDVWTPATALRDCVNEARP